MKTSTPRFQSFVEAILSATPLRTLLHDKAAVVLERIAYGAGATNWYYCENIDKLGLITDELLPGSIVSFYFDNRLEKRSYSSETKLAIEQMITNFGEVTVGILNQDHLHISCDYPAGSKDLEEHLDGLTPNATLFYGVFPAWDDDGTHAVTVTIPDLDGVVRLHPH